MVSKSKVGKKDQVDEILIYDPFRPTIPLCIDFRTKGTSINDVRRFSTPLSTYIVRRFYSYNARYFEAILTPLPTLQSDVINGRSAKREIKQTKSRYLMKKSLWKSLLLFGKYWWIHHLCLFFNFLFKSRRRFFFEICSNNRLAFIIT